MSTRQRTMSWGLLAAAFALFVGLGVATGVTDDLDDTLSGIVIQNGFLEGLARFVEELFDIIPMVVFNVLIVVALVIKGYNRAAIYVGGVNLSAVIVSASLKFSTARERPEWQSLTDFHSSATSFPSGHTLSSVALFGSLAVLTHYFIRKASVRRLVYSAIVLLLAIIALDRILLGRHYPTDIVAGASISVAIILIWLALYSPVPKLSVEIAAEPDRTPGPEARQCGVVLNPIKVETVAIFEATVREIAAASGWDVPKFYYTTVEDSGTGQTRQALADGSSLIVVCGGDGTVREVCAEAASTGVPVGILPAGTGLLLARNLDIPLYLRNAIDVAFNGANKPIDMVEVSGDGIETSHFLVMAGMGFDAAIMEGVSDEIKARVGWLAYVLSGMKALMYPALKVEISVDGGEFTSHRARTIVVGNVGTLTAGMPLIPDAAIDDGVLDVVLLHPPKFLSWVPLAVRILTRRRRTDDIINRWTGKEVVIRADHDTPRQLDGDTVGVGRELVMRNVYRELVVRVPQPVMPRTMPFARHAKALPAAAPGTTTAHKSPHAGGFKSHQARF